ncbi:MAG: SHOCT domain-containing protein [Chloroflexi bacterium]|nr:SHOCT domain-containing protein [Chloroflexota bacterium]
MMGSGMMGGFGAMGVMSIVWLVVLGLIIWAVVALVRGVSQPGSSASASSRPDSALEILKKRYARGEINKEEYEEKKKDLT